MVRCLEKTSGFTIGGRYALSLAVSCLSPFKCPQEVMAERETTRLRPLAKVFNLCGVVNLPARISAIVIKAMFIRLNRCGPNRLPLPNVNVQYFTKLYMKLLAKLLGNCNICADK